MTFAWTVLRSQLLAHSERWLEPNDDMNTEQGVIAAAIAVLDRMSNSEALREVSWRPVRLLVPTASPSAPQATPAGGGNPSAPVLSPVPAPRAPSPAPAYAEIAW
jgi:hypothetical protein